MTYPVIWLLNNGKLKEKRLLEVILEKGFHTELSELEKLTKVLVNNGAIDFAKRKAKNI